MGYYKDDPALAGGPLPPARLITGLPPAGTALGRIARSYNSVGGLIDRLAAQTGVEPMAVLSVWYVESGGAPFTPGKPIMRFENHKFYRYWGQTH